MGHGHGKVVKRPTGVVEIIPHAARRADSGNREFPHAMGRILT